MLINEETIEHFVEGERRICVVAQRAVFVWEKNSNKGTLFMILKAFAVPRNIRKGSIAFSR